MSNRKIQCIRKGKEKPLVGVANCKSRFCMVPSHGMHADCDGDRDRSADVTAESADVSDRRQRSEGRGLTCRSAPTCHNKRSTASVVLCAQRSDDRRPIHWDNFPSSFEEVEAKRSCQASPRKRVGNPKSWREDLSDVSTWRTDRWARWKPVEATQARESDHQSCSLCDTELWLILCVISVFIHHGHYSEKSVER